MKTKMRDGCWADTPGEVAVHSRLEDAWPRPAHAHHPPIPGSGRSKSDFVVVQDGRRVWVEVWGFIDRTRTVRSKTGPVPDYWRRYLKKLDIYRLLGIKLESVFKDDFASDGTLKIDLTERIRRRLSEPDGWDGPLDRFKDAMIAKVTVK
jgi:hypothetical protein